MKRERKKLVLVRDRAGNEFICSFDALKDPRHLNQDEINDCLEDAKEALKDDFSAVTIRED